MTLAVFVLAVVSAARGTWSPCGLSMLSTITPISERARHHRFWRSACWFVSGAVLGGLTIGGAMALGSWVSHTADVPASARVAVALLAAIVALAADARLGGVRLPERPRQVDATWVTRFRPWAYAGGFGYQLGTGVATYVMTNATYTMLLVGLVWLPPSGALALGAVYGACRGATILIGAPVTSPSRLRSVHRWLATSDGLSLAVTMAAQLGFVAVCLVTLDRTAVAVVGGAVVLALAWGCIARVRALARGVPAGAP